MCFISGTREANIILHCLIVMLHWSTGASAMPVAESTADTPYSEHEEVKRYTLQWCMINSATTNVSFSFYKKCASVMPEVIGRACVTAFCTCIIRSRKIELLT